MAGISGPGDPPFAIPRGEGENERPSADKQFIRNDEDGSSDEEGALQPDLSVKSADISAKEKEFMALERTLYGASKTIIRCKNCQKTGLALKGPNGKHVQGTSISLNSVLCKQAGCGKATRLSEVLRDTPGCRVWYARWCEGFKSLTGGEPSQMNPGKPSNTGSQVGMKAGGSKSKSATGRVQGNTLDRYANRPPPTSTQSAVNTENSMYIDVDATKVKTNTTVPPLPTMSWADEVDDTVPPPIPNLSAQPSRHTQQPPDDEKTRLLALLEASNKRQAEMQAELRQLRIQIDRLTRELASERAARNLGIDLGNGRGVGGRHVPGASGGGGRNG
ncbi:hypothetical protein HDU93_004980, partial [Gonapodya sp. JEL0774]